MTIPDINPGLCPLCAQPNHCALVDGGKSCWCFQAKILEEARDSIPIEADGLACVCFRCGTGEYEAVSSAVSA